MDRNDRPFLPNPILGSMMGLCPVIAVTGNFASGSVIAVGMLLSMLSLGALLPAVRGLLPERLRAPMALALAAMITALYSLGVAAYSPTIWSLTGIFLPLLLVNCLNLATLRRGIHDDESFSQWVFPAAMLYFATVLLLAAFREIAGAGRLTLPLPGDSPQTLRIFDAAPFRTLTAPMGGFILLGLLAFGYRVVLRKQGKRIP
jgi:electron transport complex protein RnfE